ncbi:MAG: GntR family transcriptional regulator [Candidatus Accumulibacter sp.]|jgi:DNA-binding GntR family transcriptional regulator|nr:GntR family transcriptional regulator [Accumulibacter sp.]
MEMGITDATIASAVNPRSPESESMGAQLYRILRAAINCGDLVPGRMISELEVSRRFSISRQPVREAFIKLNDERLIEIQRQRGTYIRRISVREALDAGHLRELIETSIAREAAENPTPAFVKALRALVAGQRKVRNDDRQAWPRHDEQFHRALAQHAGREAMWRANAAILAQMNRVRALTLDAAAPVPQLADEHAAIADAIEAANPDQAAQRMRQHLHTVLDALPDLAKRYPQHFTAD